MKTIQNDKGEQRSIPYKCSCEAALSEDRVALGTPLSGGDCADQILFTSGSEIAQSRPSSGSSGKGKQRLVFLHGAPITKEATNFFINILDCSQTSDSKYLMHHPTTLVPKIKKGGLCCLLLALPGSRQNQHITRSYGTNGHHV